MTTRSHTIARRVVLAAFLFSLSVFSASAQKVDRSKPPQLGPPPALKLPPIQRLKLSNGIPVVALEKRGVPVVQVDLIIRTGNAYDPITQRGLASTTLAMMEEGAGNRDALAFADAADYLGASLNTFAGWHTSGVRLYAPLSKLDSALALFADLVLRPRFPPEELERRKLEQLTSLLQWHDEPAQIASVLFNKTLFGSSHPYGLASMSDENVIRTMSVDDLKKFYASYFVSNNATFIVVGDVQSQTILKKLQALFGKWKSGAVPQLSLPQASQVQQSKIYLVDKTGVAQSSIRIGRIGAARMTEDYFPIVVMNTILGGSFTSRLNNNLREQHGYAYGARSRFDFRMQPGPFLAAADVQTDVTDKALLEFMKELNGMLLPVSDEELTKAKNYVALSYPGEFQSVSEIADKLGELIAYNLPDNYFNNYTQKILAVTKDDLVRVAKKYIVPDKSAIVIVGDKAKVEAGLNATNVAPVENLSIEGVLGKKPVMEKQ